MISGDVLLSARKMCWKFGSSVYGAGDDRLRRRQRLGVVRACRCRRRRSGRAWRAASMPPRRSRASVRGRRRRRQAAPDLGQLAHDDSRRSPRGWPARRRRRRADRSSVTSGMSPKRSIAVPVAERAEEPRLGPVGRDLGPERGADVAARVQLLVRGLAQELVRHADLEVDPVVHRRPRTSWSTAQMLRVHLREADVAPADHGFVGRQLLRFPEQPEVLREAFVDARDVGLSPPGPAGRSRRARRRPSR